MLNLFLAIMSSALIALIMRFSSGKVKADIGHSGGAGPAEYLTLFLKENTKPY